MEVIENYNITTIVNNTNFIIFVYLRFAKLLIFLLLTIDCRVF